MVLKRKGFKCSLCQTTSQQTVVYVEEAMQYDVVELDSKPEPKVIETFKFDVQVCPTCGYANFNIEEKVYDNYVIDEEYRELLKQNFDSDVIKNQILCLKTYEKTDQVVLKALMNLKVSWLYEDLNNQIKASEYRMNTINYLKSIPLENNSAQLYMILVDVLRKNSMFKDSKIMIKNLRNYETLNPHIKSFLDLEYELVEKGDTNNHSYREVIAKMNATN